MTSNLAGYNVGFHDGLAVAVTLARAGCNVEDIATLLDEGDPAVTNPAAYQDLLHELRSTLETDLMDLNSGRSDARGAVP